MNFYPFLDLVSVPSQPPSSVSLHVPKLKTLEHCSNQLLKFLQSTFIIFRILINLMMVNNIYTLMSKISSLVHKSLLDSIVFRQLTTDSLSDYFLMGDLNWVFQIWTDFFSKNNMSFSVIALLIDDDSKLLKVQIKKYGLIADFKLLPCMKSVNLIRFLNILFLLWLKTPSPFPWITEHISSVVPDIATVLLAFSVFHTLASGGCQNLLST